MVFTNRAVDSVSNLKLFALADLHVWWNTWAGVSQKYSLETAVDAAVRSREWSNWPLVNQVEGVVGWKTIKYNISGDSCSRAASWSCTARQLPNFEMKVLDNFTWVNPNPVVCKGVLRSVLLKLKETSMASAHEYAALSALAHGVIVGEADGMSDGSRSDGTLEGRPDAVIEGLFGARLSAWSSQWRRTWRRGWCRAWRSGWT